MRAQHSTAKIQKAKAISSCHRGLPEERAAQHDHMRRFKRAKASNWRQVSDHLQVLLARSRAPVVSKRILTR